MIQKGLLLIIHFDHLLEFFPELVNVQSRRDMNAGRHFCQAILEDRNAMIDRASIPSAKAKRPRVPIVSKAADESMINNIPTKRFMAFIEIFRTKWPKNDPVG